MSEDSPQDPPPTTTEETTTTSEPPAPTPETTPLAFPDFSKAFALSEQDKVKIQEEERQKEERRHKAERKGAMKKSRGRLLLETSLEKKDPSYLLTVKIVEAVELVENTKNPADPYVWVKLVPDPTKSKKKTQVAKGTRNPKFNETFNWELKGSTDLESIRLLVVVYDHSADSKNQFMGSFSFSLAELADPEMTTSGWFKLLDEKKGDNQNMPFLIKGKDEPKKKLTKEEEAKKKEAEKKKKEEAKKKADEMKKLAKERAEREKALAKEQEAERKEQEKLEKQKAKDAKAGKKPSTASLDVPTTSVSSTPTLQSTTSSTAGTEIAPIAPPRSIPKAKKFKIPSRVTTDDFRFLRVLGQGSFGKVLLAEFKGTDEIFAIKIMNKETILDDDDVEPTMTERRVLALTGGSPFLCSLFASFQTESRLYYVMEFINGGDLMFHLQKSDIFSFDRAQFYTAEICLGLWYLHENGVLYRDLKLDNVMLDCDGHVKITDFGMCKENIWGAGTTTTFCGTPGYLAPEILEEQPYGNSVDFWALGVMLYEMIVGDSPFDGDDDDELFEAIKKASPEFPDDLNPDAKSAIQGFLHRTPLQRLGVGRTGRDNIKGHPFFKGIDWEKLAKREVKPPFDVGVKSRKEAKNFDSEFDDATIDLTPVDKDTIEGFDQDLFNGFSFVNKHYNVSVDELSKTQEFQARPRGNGMEKFLWYRPDLPRDEVGKALKGKAPGTFFVRESASQPGCYAMAVLLSSSALWNGLIKPLNTKDGVRYKIFAGKKFESIPDLCQYYAKNPNIPDGDGKTLALIIQ